MYWNSGPMAQAQCFCGGKNNPLMWLPSIAGVEIHCIRIMRRKQMTQLSTFRLWPHLYSISQQILFHTGLIFFFMCSTLVATLADSLKESHCLLYLRSKWFNSTIKAIMKLTPILYGKIDSTWCLNIYDKLFLCLDKKVAILLELTTIQYSYIVIGSDSGRLVWSWNWTLSSYSGWCSWHMESSWIPACILERNMVEGCTAGGFEELLEELYVVSTWE